MVGLPLGLALAQGGLKIVVADAAPPAKVLDANFDGRVSALAYASVRMLAALGVWERSGAPCPADPRNPGDRRQGGPAGLAFLAAFRRRRKSAPTALGHIAENRHIRAALYGAVDAAPT